MTSDTTFRATLYDAKRWRDILNVVSAVLEEAEFAINAEGIKLRALDSSGTAMVDLDLPSVFFDEYECNKSARLRTNVKTIINLLESTSANESIEINFKEDQAKLAISLKGEYQRVFNLTTLTTEGETRIEPQVLFGAEAKIKTSSLRKVILDSQKMGDHLTISAREQTITFRTSGLNGDVVSMFKLGDDPLVEISVKRESESSYSLELLGTIIKNAPPVSEAMKIEYATDEPLKLDLGIPQGKFHLYVSPRIEEK
jgi:proliferating cell nuclear antigen